MAKIHCPATESRMLSSARDSICPRVGENDRYRNSRYYQCENILIALLRANDLKIRNVLVRVPEDLVIRRCWVHLLAPCGETAGGGAVIVKSNKDYPAAGICHGNDVLNQFTPIGGGRRVYLPLVIEPL